MFLTKKNNLFNKPQPKRDKYGNVVRNCTSMFLLPSVLSPLGYDRHEFGFVNAYLQDHTHEVLHTDCIYVLFNPNKFTKNFENYLNKVRETDIFVEEYDIAPEYMGKVMLVVKFNSKYNYVKDLVLQGKFSQIDAEYMEKKIIPVKDFNGTPTLPWKIYTKNNILREELEKDLGVKIDNKAELHSIPDLSNEIYNYNEKIGYVQ